MRRALIILATVAIAVAASVGVLTVSYINSQDYTSDTLPAGANVNGVDCSDMTYDQAAKVLTEKRNSESLVIRGKLGEQLDVYTDFGCEYDVENQLANIKKDNFVTAALNHYLHLPFYAQVPMPVKDSGSDLKKQVASSEFLSRSSVVETRNAYVDLEDEDFPIVPEIYGNKTDVDAYFDDVLEAISLGEPVFEFDESTYLSPPEVKADDPELIKYQKFCRAYLGQKIKYDLDKDSFTISPQVLDGLMKDDYSGNPDEDAVRKYVQKLKKNYDIVGGEQTIKSLTGKTFKVSGGDYGWIIDEEGEIAQLMKDIASHKDVSREPVFSQTGHGEYSKTLDLGDTYVDVDITKQHVVYFENGKKLFECDCVTGCWAAGHSTPTGVFDLNGKGRNITLKSGGKKKDPGYYESFVSYWMPFLGNSYGLHDANWRSNFGGDIYKYSGSHGCVNLPPSKAGKLYDLISVGTIVVVHY